MCARVQAVDPVDVDATPLYEDPVSTDEDPINGMPFPFRPNPSAPSVVMYPSLDPVAPKLPHVAVQEAPATIVLPPPPPPVRQFTLDTIQLLDDDDFPAPRPQTAAHLSPPAPPANAPALASVELPDNSLPFMALPTQRYYAPLVPDGTGSAESNNNSSDTHKF